MNGDDNDDGGPQRIVVTIDLAGGPGTTTIAATIFLNVLNHLEHEGHQPPLGSLEISAPTTTP